MKLKEARNYEYKDFIKLPKSEQKKVAQVINKSVTRRMQNLEKIGADSYAVNAYNKAGGVISVKGQSTLQLWRSVARGKTFLDAKTSTVRGYIAVIENMAEQMHIPEYVTMSSDERNSFWDLYNEVEATGFFEELRAHDLSSDYIQTVIYELYDSGYTYEDTTTVIDILREEFGVYDRLHTNNMEGF